MTTTALERVTFRGTVASEWIKLRSLRSTTITLVALLAAVIGFGLIAAASVGSGTGPGRGASDPVGLSLAGVTLGQLIIGVLGVLVISGEYSTGMIRATFSAVPRRLPVLWAKTLVFGLVALAVSLVAAFGAFFGAQVVLGSDAASIGDEHVLRAVLGAAVYLAGVGLLGLALGALLRHTAGAIGALVGIVLIAPGLVSLLPDSWSDAVAAYLPSNAGNSIMALTTTSDQLSAGTGLAVFVAWIAVALAAAAVLLRRRDA
ncbi:ABC transporter permease subunit [Cryptosporangium phraense]|uniref:ABC transporter permease subunit n=1 Tax=Cryptosporangium phraense TaxID=2593070 RepID=A0A545AP57_9ACTN|nr:ABC transporter permease subunit [Cryptosporangium phraense]TQS43073.1 ABC transporter permease subunit [Cryptosporangium phraense]